MLRRIGERFPKYEQFDPLVPVWCATPGEGRVIHRFFDTSPFSPSGRFLALFRLPYEDRLPAPGDAGQVLLVDLETGEERVVAETRGWETQLGANIQWGADDTQLFFNEVEPSTWEPHGVRLNPQSGDRKRLNGCIYKVSPDGKKAISANLKCLRRTQAGYGVMVPDEHVPRNIGLRKDDGLYITDTESGDCNLLISIRDIVKRTVTEKALYKYKDLEVYGFHCKWNPQGDRLLFSLRSFPKNHPRRFEAISDDVVKFDVFTMREDGSELFNVVPASEWERGGHHINWFPDGERLSMNLNLPEVDLGGYWLKKRLRKIRILKEIKHFLRKTLSNAGKSNLRFVKVKCDGTGLERILNGIPGSGHPTVHPNGRHILTDTYVQDPVAFGDGTVPIRLIDINNRDEKRLIRIRTRTEQQASCIALRVDPHPAWDFHQRWIAFNAFSDGTRRVYIADLTELVG
ncbi:MAG: TolB family protein [Gammaproteobacteria bacterium]